MKTLVSLIIPSGNSFETIGTFLKSIKEQTYSDVEIITVDNFSKDKTKKIAENHGTRIVLTNAKRSEARNLGAEKARSQFIFRGF